MSYSSTTVRSTKRNIALPPATEIRLQACAGFELRRHDALSADLTGKLVLTHGNRGFVVAHSSTAIIEVLYRSNTASLYSTVSG